jgi:hypothetical protein
LIALNFNGPVVVRKFFINPFIGAFRIPFQIQGEQAVQVVGKEGHGQVKVHFDDHGRGKPVQMKEFDLLANALLYNPAPAIFPYHLIGADIKIIGYD